MARWNNPHSTANFTASAGQQLPHGVAGVDVVVNDQNFCGGVHSITHGSNDVQSRATILQCFILQFAVMLLHNARCDDRPSTIIRNKQ
jgi:hypothetical protein